MQAELVAGLAAHLAAHGVGVWRPTGAYTAAETAITDTVVPEAPDALIVLSAYPLSDDPGTDSRVGVQVRTRAPGPNPRTVAGLDDSVFYLLHGAEHLQFPGVTVTLIERTSGVIIGRDTSGRWERSTNYTALVYWPAPNRH